MVYRTFKRVATRAGAVALLLVVGACGDSAPTGPTFQNPSTIRVDNQLQGPVLFFRVRACGTVDWSEDLLSNHPVDGTIQPGATKDFTVEAGCYDLQAQHLATPDPGPLLTQETEDIVASPVTPATWTLRGQPTPG